MADPGLLQVLEWLPSRNNSRDMHRSFSSSGGRNPHFSSSVHRSRLFSSNVHRSSFSSSGHRSSFSSSGHRSSFSSSVRRKFNSSVRRRQKHFAESLGRRLAIEPKAAETSGGAKHDRPRSDFVPKRLT
jgi:hypothetical protein